MQTLLSLQPSQMSRALRIGPSPQSQQGLYHRSGAEAGVQPPTDAPPLPSVRLFRKMHGAAAQIAARSSQTGPLTAAAGSPANAAAAVTSGSVRVEIAADPAAASASGSADAGGAGIELAALRLRSGAAAASAAHQVGAEDAAAASSQDARPLALARTPAASDCATACSRLRPPPLSWLEPAVASEAQAAAPIAAAPAPAAAVPRATRWQQAVQRRTMALLRAPVHAAVGAVLGLSRVAAVFGETRPFLQPG